MSLPFEVTKKDTPVVSLCEQGDMGLFGDPLSKEDQEKYKRDQEAKETKESN